MEEDPAGLREEALRPAKRAELTRASAQLYAAIQSAYDRHKADEQAARDLEAAVADVRASGAGSPGVLSRFGRSMREGAGSLAASVLLALTSALPIAYSSPAYADPPTAESGATAGQTEVSAENPIHRTLDVRRPRRRLGPATLSTFNYAAPLDAGSQSVLSNNDANQVTVTTWYRGDDGRLTPTLTTLAPGETKVIDALAGSRLAFFNQVGASDPKNFQVRIQSTHTVNGHEVTENVRAVALEELLATGEHAWLPGVVDPLTATEGLLVFNGQATEGHFDLGRYNASGNLLAGKENLVIPAFSFLAVPDAYAYFNVTPGPSTAKGYTKLFPLSNGLMAIAIHNNASGDHDTIRALSRGQMQNNFVFPILQRLTSGVPFAKYVDLHTINLDQEPYTQLFNVAFQARGATGPATFFNGRNLHALTHDVFVEAMNTFFGDLTATEYNGSGLASNAATVFTASKIRAAMPHGDVGQWVDAMNQRDACGTWDQYQCHLIGLKQNSDYQTVLGVANRGSLETTVKAEVVTAAGVIAGTQQFTLGAYENREIDILSQYGNLDNARIRLSVVHSGNTGNDIDAFHAWTRTTGPNGDEDIQIARRGTVAPQDISALVENFLHVKLDPMLDAYFYLNKAETYALFNGSFGDQLLEKMFLGSTTWQGTLEEFKAHYRVLFDGSMTNYETCQTFDPLQLDFRDNNRWVMIGIAPNCNTSNNKLRSEDLAASRLIVRNFFTDRLTAHPELYGNLSLSFEPTWNTYDPTTP